GARSVGATMRFAVTGPEPFGVNVTWSVAVSWGASESGPDVSSENCDASLPMIVTDGISTCVWPTFVTVAVTGSELLPATTMPKSIGAGMTEMPDVAPLPTSGSLTIGFTGSSLVKSISALSIP